MSAKAIPLATAIFALAAVAQNPADSNVEKTFHFTGIDTPVAAQETANAIRIVADIQFATVDNSAKTLSLRGTANQIALAGWVLPQLDRPDGSQPAPPNQDPATREYRLNSSSDAVVRVFNLSNTPDPRDMQEIINAIRSITEVQRVVAISRTKTVVLRGTAEQVAASEWLIAGLDRPNASQAQNPKPLEYLLEDPRTKAPRTSAARVYFLNETRTPQAMQELINSVRSLTELQRVVAFYHEKAIILRGTPDQAAMAEWLIHLLDRTTAQGQNPSNEYRLAGSSDVSRVFYLTRNATPQGLQALLTEVRSTTNIMRATVCIGPGALAVRGSAGQVAMAEKLIQEKEKL